MMHDRSQREPDSFCRAEQIHPEDAPTVQKASLVFYSLITLTTAVDFWHPRHILTLSGPSKPSSRRHFDQRFDRNCSSCHDDCIPNPEENGLHGLFPRPANHRRPTSVRNTHPHRKWTRHIGYPSLYDPTIEDSYSVTRTIDGTTYSLALTDTAGQEEYRGLWSAANLGSDAFLLVYDITQPSSLEALEYFNNLIDMDRENRIESGRVLPACIVAGNKCDLQAMRQVGAREGLDWARARRYGFMETSAREMVNIEETFALLVRRVVEARRNAAQGISAPNSHLPSSTARTRPLDPINKPLGEKGSAGGLRNFDDVETDGQDDAQRRQREDEERRQRSSQPWWQAFTRLKCW
nr:ras-like protein 1 [Quercus suber]